MRDIAIYGAGGLGREVACLIKKINDTEGAHWNLIGFFDDGIEPGSRNEYGEVLGGIDSLNSWEEPLAVVFSIGSPAIIRSLVSKISNPGIIFPNIIAPDVIFLDRDNLRLGKGNIISWHCIVSCNVEIGNFNIFNGNISIGHDAKVGNYNSIMPAVKISGGVHIGDCNFLGVNSVILQYKSVGNDTTIGAGSVVLRSTKNGCTYVGNPAKKIEY